MILKQTNYEDLLGVVGSIKYRNQDVRESFVLGCKNISDNYKYSRYNRYYILYNNNIPIVPIQIDRLGFIVFFISKDLEPIADGLKLVKKLKVLLKWYTDNYETTLFVKTANWYKEANKLNRIIGFTKYIVNKDFTIWVYENKRIVKAVQ